jgi:uncharacterized RDD family membrane protein YckC
MSSMVFCRGCGQSIHETAPTCPHCGAVQAAVQVGATGSAAVSASDEHPGFWLRVVAALIDTVAMYAIAFAAGLVLGLGMGIAGAEEGEAEAVGTVVGLLTAWLYSALFESSRHQATPGKMALGIVVTDLNGERIGFGRATGRHFGKIVSGLILGIGYLMCAFTARKQCLHDMMAGCLLYRKR